MADLKLHPWEPEETVGTLWHRFVTRDPAEAFHAEAAVSLESMAGRIGLFFRGLGGTPGTEIAEVAEDVVRHRRSFWRRVGHAEEKSCQARFDGERVQLPREIGLFAERRLNEACFLWLAAFAAHDSDLPASDSDPLRDDLLKLRHARQVEGRVLSACPGLRRRHAELRAATLAQRVSASLPPAEAGVEAVIRTLLGEQQGTPDMLASAMLGFVSGESDDMPEVAAPKDYRTWQRVVLWPDRLAPRHRDERGNRQADRGGTAEQGPSRKRRAARRKSDQANRRDSLILHRFETILSWTDFLNLNRKVEDDDEASARKAANDADEMAVTDIDQRPATRLAFDLDMAPQDIDRERLAGVHLQPEWDYRRGAYNEDHVQVLFADQEAVDAEEIEPRSKAQRRRLDAVRKQFEALRPRRMAMPRQPDGDEFDLDALVRSQIDIRVTGNGSDRVYRRTANAERDLAVATLVDTSRSTESSVGGQSVIAIARESLAALGFGLAATGDRHAIYSFSSLRRNRVFVNRVKAFDEAMGAGVEARIAALRPGFYTRLGAAVRHAAQELAASGAARRLLLVITDGKPNDLDHYEGRYGIEDSRKAVIEARRLGLAVFGIAIDRRAEQYIPRIFGQNGYAIVSHPERLMEALPHIYRHLVT